MAHPGAVMVPFIGLIPGGLRPGRKIQVNGMVLPTTNRFSINLQCGPNCNPRDDIALHMNFRYDQQVPYVVRNSLMMQQWGIEEGHGYLSFGRGQSFEVRIDVEHDHCKIFFNGHHFTDFRYRMGLERATYITVDGDVALHAVKVDGMDMATHRFPQPVIGFGGAYGTPHTGTAVPHAGVPPMHMYPGYPTHPPPHSEAIPVAMATGMAMGATVAHVAHTDKHAKKAMKKQQKAMKKAMKHHKPSHHKPSHHKPSHHHGMHGHHGHRSSSSSSSSSSSEEE